MDPSTNVTETNDSGDESTNKNAPQSDDYYENPLSPVLCNATHNRKYIFGRRLNNKKTRVKLSDRFDTSGSIAEPKPPLEPPLKKQQNAPPNEHNKPRKPDRTEFPFKKPVLPAPHGKKSHTHSPGFTTATGKTIDIRNADLELHSKLFRDIFNESGDSTRRNKHTFLKRQRNLESVREEEGESCGVSFTQEIRESGISDTQICSVVDSVLSDEKTFAGFSDYDYKLSLSKSRHIQQVAEYLISSIEQFNNDNRGAFCKKGAANKSIFSISRGDNKGPEHGFFKTAGGRSLRVDEQKLKSAAKLYEGTIDRFDCETVQFEKNLKPSGGFRTVAGASLQSPKLINPAARIFSDLFSEEELKNMAPLKTSFSTNHTKPKTNTKAPSVFVEHDETYAPITPKNPNLNKPKRRLGISSCNQINIPHNNIEKAKLLFQESPIKLGYNNTPNASSTPIKFNSNNNNNNTPIKQHFLKTASTPIKNVDGTSRLREDDPLLSDTCKTILDCKIYTDSPVLIQKPTPGHIAEWLENLQHEQKLLEKKLSIVKQKQVALLQQEDALKQTVRSQRRDGVLFRRKTSHRQIELKYYVKNKRPFAGESNGSETCHEINPANADFVHFNCVACAEPVVETLDGAVVIPNCKNLVGLREIEGSFKSAPGVEARLIPKGWICNHYRWIVWKLAAYERAFPDDFGGAFCLENVMQQLKYRYDREIDKVQRSALRKIYEKDDSPRKRLVLCVSNITTIQTNNKNIQYELELTDGWYAIKTTIDEPLSQQISLNKIAIGTKLITFGAELLSCEACHPLEATDSIKLKIAFNSTRRARWYSKLGYQKNPTPFTVPLDSIKPTGGMVARLKLHIVRVYPLKYMEKLDGLTVWRNKRAEERKAVEWENERSKSYEKVKENVYKEEEQERRLPAVHVEKTDVTQIACAETLYAIIQNSRDPDSVHDALTPTQKTALRDYQQSLSLKNIETINGKINEQITRLKNAQRDVRPVLKLVVIDAYEKNSERGVSLHIWNPNEQHSQSLKEGATFNVYNVLPKRNGDLTSCKSTKFEASPPCGFHGDKFKRQTLPIGSACRFECKPFLDEFDTVGVVVRTAISCFAQELWLCDHLGWLLCVKVMEGPKNCLLLNELERGRVVGCCNLVLCAPHEKYGQAVANQQSVVTCYPQHKHLQDSLEDFKQKLPKDLGDLLDDCDNKLNVLTFKSDDSASGGAFFDDSIDDNAFNQTKLTSTDVALSLIDFDQFE